MQPEEFPLQVPRKLYEYIAFRKPILAITNLDSATAKIIRDNHFGLVVPDLISDLESALKTLYEQWNRGELEVPPSTASNRFMNKHLTTKLHEVFRKCCGIQ